MISDQTRKCPSTLSALAADRPAPVERGLEESQLRMNSPTTTRLRVPAALMLAHHSWSSDW